MLLLLSLLSLKPGPSCLLFLQNLQGNLQPIIPIHAPARKSYPLLESPHRPLAHPISVSIATGLLHWYYLQLQDVRIFPASFENLSLATLYATLPQSAHFHKSASRQHQPATLPVHPCHPFLPHQEVNHLSPHAEPPALSIPSPAHALAPLTNQTQPTMPTHPFHQHQRPPPQICSQPHLNQTAGHSVSPQILDQVHPQSNHPLP